MDCAANNGYLEIVQWLHINTTEGCSSTAMDYAAERGHLEIVQWLHINTTEGSVGARAELCCTKYAMDCAARSGHLDTVKWLHINTIEGCTEGAMNWAAENGQLEIVNGYTLIELKDVLITQWAAENGHLDTVKLLHYNRTEGCYENAMDYAAAHGHLKIVKWLSINRAEGVLHLQCTGQPKMDIWL